MPAIMAVHMAKSSARCFASQVSVIIQADTPVMGPYMSRAIGTIQAQHNATATASAPPTSSRSRSSSDSTEVREAAPGAPSADDPVGAPVNACELGVGAIEIQLDWPFGPALSAHELGVRELESTGQVDVHAVLRARHRVPDGLRLSFDNPGHLELCRAARQVDAELNRLEEGGEDLHDRRREDLPDQRAGLGLLPVRHRLERGTLLVAGALVDDGSERSAAQVNGAG